MEQRLIIAVNNSYNAEGYRVGKKTAAEDGSEKQTYYLYEADKVILELDQDGNQTARNVYGTNLLMRTVDGETYYYLYNGHADVTALITGDGTIAATYYYDAFGNILESTGEVNNSILYSGYQYDEETGLYYLNARMYDPKIARFLQEDTYTGDAKDPLSLNLYTYCSNNPIIYWDPTGHSKIGKAWKKFWHKAWKEVKKAADATASYTGSFIGETFNNFWYKPTYSITKGFGSVEKWIFGTNHINASAEAYKRDTDITVKAFHNLGSNKTAHQYGSVGGIIFGQSLGLYAFTKIGMEEGLGSSLPPLQQNMILNGASATVSAGLIGYADGQRGNELIINAASEGVVVADIGAIVEFISPKISNLINKAANSADDLIKGASNAGKGFESFNDLKKYLGSPGEGNQWHHIVEQSQINKSGFSVSQIQNTDNIIAIDKATHAKISGYYSSKQAFTGGKTVRDWLAGQSYEAQYEFGNNVLKNYGVIK